MNSPTALEIRSDTVRNLARLRYSGVITAAHMEDGMGQVAAFLPQLRTGFTVIVDLSGMDSMELECVPHLTKMMDLCRDQGLGTVIRVLPDRSKDIGLNILSLIHYRGQVRIMTCDTLEEAEKLLD